jgi:endonuclease/exonuclease/phosphatase family metal-dependent hydrolase
VDSGNAILSAYPLKDPTRIALSLRSDQSSIERYFYLKRNILRAQLDLPAPSTDEPVMLIVTHTAAYSQDGTKHEHIDRFRAELDRWAAQAVVLGGGDLNALPPGSRKTHDFDDSACTDDFEADDYSREQDWLVPLYEDYTPAIPLPDYERDNAPYFTHTTRADGFWNRKLDYLFTNRTFAPGSTQVHQDTRHGGMATMPLSDHAPMSAVLQLDDSAAASADAGVTDGSSP